MTATVDCAKCGRPLASACGPGTVRTDDGTEFFSRRGLSIRCPNCGEVTRRPISSPNPLDGQELPRQDMAN